MPQLCLATKRIKKGEDKGRPDKDEKDAARATVLQRLPHQCFRPPVLVLQACLVTYLEVFISKVA